MKKHLREFFEQEAVGAARSREAKKADVKRRRDRFVRYLNEKIGQIEANGNPAAAEQMRAFWSKFRRYRKGVQQGSPPKGG